MEEEAAKKKMEAAAAAKKEEEEAQRQSEGKGRMMESDAAITLLATTRCAQYRGVPVEHVYSTLSQAYP